MEKQLKAILQKVRPLLKVFRVIAKHHYFLSLLVILGFLYYAVYTVTNLLEKPSDETYRTEKISSGVKTNFDQTTIERIRNLKKSDEKPSAPTPSGSGRTNPFAE